MKAARKMLGLSRKKKTTESLHKKITDSRIYVEIFHDAENCPIKPTTNGEKLHDIILERVLYVSMGTFTAEQLAESAVNWRLVLPAANANTNKVGDSRRSEVSALHDSVDSKRTVPSKALKDMEGKGMVSSNLEEQVGSVTVVMKDMMKDFLNANFKISEARKVNTIVVVISGSRDYTVSVAQIKQSGFRVICIHGNDIPSFADLLPRRMVLDIWEECLLLADNENGTNKGQNYRASKEVLVINSPPKQIIARSIQKSMQQSLPVSMTNTTSARTNEDTLLSGVTDPDDLSLIDSPVPPSLLSPTPNHTTTNNNFMKPIEEDIPMTGRGEVGGRGGARRPSTVLYRTTESAIKRKIQEAKEKKYRSSKENKGGATVSRYPTSYDADDIYGNRNNENDENYLDDDNDDDYVPVTEKLMVKPPKGKSNTSNGATAQKPNRLERQSSGQIRTDGATHIFHKINDDYYYAQLTIILTDCAKELFRALYYQRDKCMTTMDLLTFYQRYPKYQYIIGKIEDYINTRETGDLFIWSTSWVPHKSKRELDEPIRYRTGEYILQLRRPISQYLANQILSLRCTARSSIQHHLNNNAMPPHTIVDSSPILSPTHHTNHPFSPTTTPHMNSMNPMMSPTTTHPYINTSNTNNNTTTTTATHSHSTNRHGRSYSHYSDSEYNDGDKHSRGGGGGPSSTHKSRTRHTTDHTTTNNNNNNNNFNLIYFGILIFILYSLQSFTLAAKR